MIVSVMCTNFDCAEFEVEKQIDLPEPVDNVVMVAKHICKVCGYTVYER
jgi:hypothetical protein